LHETAVPPPVIRMAREALVLAKAIATTQIPNRFYLKRLYT
jgi:hypothetical protein